MKFSSININIAPNISGNLISLENNFKIILVPRLDFSETHASLIVRFGSIHNKFINKLSNDEINIPHGTAHFLEHKMFEQKNKMEVFKEFNKIGANANAYTTYCKTAYIFSCTNKINEAMAILLDYVSNPHFTKENVFKEQGIISEEIKMYNDDLPYLSYKEVMNLAYNKHELGIDIAGNIESIGQITPDLLYMCYDNFYLPSNMILIVCGNFDEKCLLNTIFAQKSIFSLKKAAYKLQEKKDIHNYKTKYIRNFVNSQTNYVSILYKERFLYDDIKKNIFRAIKIQLINEIIFSEISETYLKMLDNNLIESKLEFYSEYDKLWGHTIYYTTTRYPKKFTEFFKKIWRNLEIGYNDFIMVKKAHIARYYRDMIYPSFIVDFLSNFYYDGTFWSINTIIDYLENLTFEEFQSEFLRMKSVILSNLYITVLERRRT